MSLRIVHDSHIQEAIKPQNRPQYQYRPRPQTQNFLPTSALSAQQRSLIYRIYILGAGAKFGDRVGQSPDPLRYHRIPDQLFLNECCTVYKYDSLATYVLPETAQTYTLGGQRLTHSFFCRFIQSLESLLYTTSQMDGIHGEDPRQASGVPPWFEKVPLPFVHEPNLGNEQKRIESNWPLPC